MLSAARYGNNSDPSMPPLHSTFRFLNITNLADVRKGAKPVLVREVWVGVGGRVWVLGMHQQCGLGAAACIRFLSVIPLPFN